jgi:hypothetical protein
MGIKSLEDVVKKIVLMSFLFVLSTKLFSQEFVNCHDATDDYFQINNIKMQIIEKINDQCMLSVSATNNYPNYRNYMFNTASELIVFNSFDGGSPADSTGARSYSFLTKKNELQFRILDHQIQVKTPAGHIFTFSDKTGDLEKIKGLYYTFDEEVRGDNEGGLDLHPMKGLLLDEGWQQGELPRISFKRHSLFKDALGHMCSQENSKLFKHILDGRGQVDGAYFQYPTRQELKTFLNSECPSIEYK